MYGEKCMWNVWYEYICLTKSLGQARRQDGKEYGRGGGGGGDKILYVQEVVTHFIY